MARGRKSPYKIIDSFQLENRTKWLWPPTMTTPLPDAAARQKNAADRQKQLLALGLLLQALFLVLVVWPLLIWKHEPSLETHLVSIAGADLKGAALYSGSAAVL